MRNAALCQGGKMEEAGKAVFALRDATKTYGANRQRSVKAAGTP